MTKKILASAFIAILAAACAAESDELDGQRNNNNQNPGGENPGGENPGGENPGTPGDPTQPGNCKEGLPHTGFAGTNFTADRKAGGIGVDRRRIKPFTALQAEFQRAIGTVPGGLATNVAAYGQVPNRWYSEPSAGAVSLFTTYNIAFTGCYDTMAAAEYQEMPTAASAVATCAKLQRKIWQRTATPDEQKICSDFIQGLTTETVARRRWAHACASITTSTGFTTY